MAIVVGQEANSSIINDLPIGYFYYLVPKTEIDKATYLGFVDTIQNVTYNPFIEPEDVTTLIDTPFNTDKYGTPSCGMPKCYKIATYDVIDKHLYSRNIFTTKENNFTGYDPKIYTYPFRYFLLTDYFNPPLLIQPQYINNTGNKLNIKVRTLPHSTQAKYNLYVEGYKNDFYGRLEGMVNSQSIMMPVTSSVYSQFLSTSQNSYYQGIQNNLLENNLSLHQSNRNANLDIFTNNMNVDSANINNVVSALGNFATLLTGNTNGISGLVNNGLNAYSTWSNNKIFQKTLQNNISNVGEQHRLNEYERTANHNAKMRDMLNTPNVIKSTGNDSLFNLANANNSVALVEYEINKNAKIRLSNFFKRYGYKYNTYNNLSHVMYNRKYYNYVKTNVCNIFGNNVPNEVIDEVKEIFNRGITIWHVENGAQPLKYDYKGDNVEV